MRIPWDPSPAQAPRSGHPVYAVVGGVSHVTLGVLFCLVRLGESGVGGGKMREDEERGEER